jgi:hypothetical protein
LYLATKALQTVPTSKDDDTTTWDIDDDKTKKLVHVVVKGETVLFKVAFFVLTHFATQTAKDLLYKTFGGDRRAKQQWWALVHDSDRAALLPLSECSIAQGTCVTQSMKLKTGSVAGIFKDLCNGDANLHSWKTLHSIKNKHELTLDGPQPDVEDADSKPNPNPNPNPNPATEEKRSLRSLRSMAKAKGSDTGKGSDKGGEEGSGDGSDGQEGGGKGDGGSEGRGGKASSGKKGKGRGGKGSGGRGSQQRANPRVVRIAGQISSEPSSRQ